ncbi:hypothetical protein K8O93_12775 [Gordonia bronchialis]|uniref:hypothetical protein n=1 Tax=Gordonia bronchialis TaxID=2054 RepID=UPI001CC0675B|nr:hypothetical protein [Gordonia bronchialis]UAK36227.1 hypothetical protein K8O93_12775 [Gordonia bronchialis]
MSVAPDARLPDVGDAPVHRGAVAQRYSSRLGERGAPWQQTLISGLLFVPIVAWWPTSLLLFRFDPTHSMKVIERVAYVEAHGPSMSLQLRWVLTVLIAVYFVAVIVIWARSRTRALVALPVAAIGAAVFWGGQVPYLVTEGSNFATTLARWAPLAVSLMIVAWSIARRRHLWWLMGIPVIVYVAVVAAQFRQIGPTDVVIKSLGVEQGINSPFWPSTHEAYGDLVDLIAGIVALWAIDAGFGAVFSRRSRDQGFIQA